MSFTTDLQKAYADHVYKQLKADIPEATIAMQVYAPIRSGLLRDHTYCFLKPESNDERAIIRMIASPPHTPKYPGHSRSGKKSDWGSGHAQFSNGLHRISRKPMRSTGWWDRSVDAAVRVFKS